MKVKEHLYFMYDALKNVTSIFDGQQKQQASGKLDVLPIAFTQGPVVKGQADCAFPIMRMRSQTTAGVRRFTEVTRCPGTIE